VDRAIKMSQDGGEPLEVVSSGGLPPLAWLLDLKRPRPMLVCGSDVEVFKDGFFEGCWAGDFAARDFGTARHVFGSGATRPSDGRWLVTTASHLCDAVYMLERDGRYVVSNSLAFLTRWAELELPFDPGIAARMVSVRAGVDGYERLLFQGDGWSIRRACFDNLEVGVGEPRWVAKPALSQRFMSFESYERYLLDQLRLAAANGTDPRRLGAPYELTSTCSSGYDSSACAALVASLGARKAFTIVDARGGGSDSGRHLLDRLGLRAVEVKRPPRPSGQEFTEAEFIATGMGGDEFPFAAFGPYLRRSILVTGFNGGDMWGCEGAVSRNARRHDEPAGASLAEFRLRCGFVHVPIGWIGFESQPELRRLCLSPEMAPWETGTSYERPIARRLLEERGVPRGEFGVVKRATSMTFYFASYWWSKAALAELRRLEHKHLPNIAERLAYRVGGLWKTGAFTAYFAAKRLGKQLGLAKTLDAWRDRLFPNFWGAAYAHPRYGSMAMLWGQAKIRDRYPRARDLDIHRQADRAA
jgi:hypothetical protein